MKLMELTPGLNLPKDINFGAEVTPASQVIIEIKINVTACNIRENLQFSYQILCGVDSETMIGEPITYRFSVLSEQLQEDFKNIPIEIINRPRGSHVKISKNRYTLSYLAQNKSMNLCEVDERRLNNSLE